MTARGLKNLACLLCCAIVIHGIDLGETSNGEANEEGPPGSEPGGMATGFACEGSELEIHCSNGTTISIIHANYGRLDENICNDNVMPVDITQRWERKCISNQSLDIVRQRCEDTVSCGVLASKDVFGGICDSKSSYLEVDYVCKDGVERVGTETLTTSQMTTPTEDRSTVNIDHVTTSAPVLDGNFCPGFTFRSVHWPATLAGTVAVQPCPQNPSSSDGPFTRWSCSSTTSQWIGHPDLSQCRSRMVIDAQSKMKTMKVGFSLMSMNELLESLLTLSRQKDLIGGDLTSMMSTIKDILDESDLNLNVVDGRMRSSFAQNVSKAVLDISSNFLGDNIAATWLDLPDAVQVETATRLMSAVEDGAYLLASTIDANQSIVNVASNIVVEVRSYLGARDQAGSRKISFPPPVDPSDGSASWIRTSGSISISRSSFVQNTSDPIPVVFSLFNHLDKWLRTSDTSGGKYENSVTYDSNELEGPSSGFVNTKIISASVGKRRWQKLKEPMRYVLEHNQMINVSGPACVFWNYSEKTYQGDWSSEGCRVVTSNDSHTTCECDHLTNFAVLMSVTPHKMSAVHQFSLSVITYFGCLVSLVCLVLAFATFQIFKNLQCDRNTIHKHLTLNLFLGELLFLFGIGLTSSPAVCSVVAGFLHYFFLTAFAWMCLEGVQLYVLLIEVFEAEKSRIKWYYASAYGIPAIIVAITAAVAHDGYGTADHCWLSVTNGVIWAFVGPVVIIVAVNTVMLCIALYTMCRHAATAAACKMRQKTRAENIGSWIKGAFVLVILLGTTWVFGLFYINQHSIFMAYIFTIFNSLQGFFIFVFHCLMSEKVQKEYKRWIQRNHWLPERFRVKYGGASASAAASSGAANNSTSSGTNYIFRLLRNRKRENSLSGSSFQKIHTRSKNSKDDSSGKSKRLTYSSTTSDSARQTDSTGFPSQDYDDGMTEDPSGYLDPALTRVDENEFGFRDFDTAGEMSAIEGSVVFMDYATSGSNRDPHKPERK